MNNHPEELTLARAYRLGQPFEELSAQQISRIMDRGRALHRWFKGHKALHSTIGFSVIVFLLGADYLVLMRLPKLFLPAGGTDSWIVLLLSSCVVGSLHSYLMYSLSVYSLHEGAAHRNIFPPEGAFSRLGHAIASNLCRLAAGEPDFYSSHHMAHHAKFGTEEDGEFLNFVVPRRYWMTFFPLAAFINFTDFVIHRPPTYTRSRLISAFFSVSYNLVYGYFLYRAFGLPFTLLTMLVFLPHVGFYLDRVRQFTEHNLMPLDNRNGSRSFGMGFWGLLVGGGPWGSPCHWEHHLVASLPWYQQLILHRYVVKLLTPCQREQFLIRPFIGFPRLWWRLIQNSRSFLRRSEI